MDYYPNTNELRVVNRLVRKINYCNKYLAKYRAREDLEARIREDLVELQMEKANMVARMKVTVKNWKVVPQNVLDIYF
uniref:AsIV-cont00048-ORF3 n=1 Tax=Apophua simplicipes ichnovirus TaxID=1329648 RepID=S5DMJ9_9VIRU|nr:AsIV-cont00048-ORF3 [Apophua simplicipes ichnovirus]